MKDQICRAFCDELSVRQIDRGYAISTAYEDVAGEPIGFYALGPDANSRYRLVDSGTTVAFIEAAGATLDSRTRLEAFRELLAEYSALYDDDRGELVIPDLEESELPAASLNFMALLLRLKDLLLITRERVESTFREDVITALRERLGGQATIKESEPPAPKLADVVPDLILQAPNHTPVALFLATTDAKVSEAIYLQMIAAHEAKIPLRVIAMLEHDSSVTRVLRQRADNRLDAVPRYRRDEHAAIERVAKEVLDIERLSSSVH
jgi:hypothetical protein